MLQYDFYEARMKTKKYENIFASDVGQDLWNFIQEETVVRSLLLATHLNKSPVAAISDLILARFGVKDHNLTPRKRVENGFATRYHTTPHFDRIKQFIGVLVKVILYSHGCTISSRNASSNDPLKIFSNSARYDNPNFRKLRDSAR